MVFLCTASGILTTKSEQLETGSLAIIRMCQYAGRLKRS
jgi:hypothetical protein